MASVPRSMRNVLLATALLLLSVSASVEQADSDISLTFSDIRNLGDFVSDLLARGLHATIASICIHQGQGSGVNASVEVFGRLAAVLIQKFIYAVPCDAHIPPRPPVVCSANPLGSSRSCRRSDQADIHVINSHQLERAMEEVLERYRASVGGVRQVVVGRQLQPSTRVAAGVASWIIASYFREVQVVKIQEVFSFSQAEEAVVQPLGTWQAGNGLQLTHPPGIGPHNFQGHTITIASFPYPPFFMTRENCTRPDNATEGSEDSQDDPGSKDLRCFSDLSTRMLNEEQYVGYLIDIINTLASKLNFTYRVVLPASRKDQTFGVGRGDNYSGIVGMIAKQEAEIALASLSISKERLDDIDFSFHIDYFVRNIFIRSNATHSNIGWGTYALSFELSAWLGTAGLLAVTSVILWILSHGEISEVPADILSFRDILFMLFSCLVQQGAPTTPVTWRGRSVFWLFWVSSVIVHAYYTARLTSYLTVSTVTLPFATFPAAVASYPKWEIGIMTGTPLETFIKEAKGKNYKLLTDRLDADPKLFVDNEDEGAAKVLTRNYAFLTDNPSMRYALKNNCSIREINVGLFPSFGRMGYTKNLPFAGALNKEISRLYDGGLLDRLKRQWWGRKIPCEKPSAFTELDFTHTVTAFLLLFLGALVSLFLLILEKVHKKMKSRRRSHKSGIVVAKKRRRAKEKYGLSKDRLGGVSAMPSEQFTYVENIEKLPSDR